MKVDKIRLARNALLGDGSFWRHPECINYKLIFHSVNKGYLEFKASGIHRPVVLCRPGNSRRAGVYPNSKPLYSLTTLVDSVYTEYQSRSRLSVLSEIDLYDLALWFLDDGCTIERRDAHKPGSLMRYRYFLCVGSLCSDFGATDTFFRCVRRACGLSGRHCIGSIQKNNSKATANNKSWCVPVYIAEKIIAVAKSFGVSGFESKLRTSHG